MGSLMPGWASPAKDSNYEKTMRNKSLTKERIEEYWKMKKKIEEEHLQAISACTSPILTPQVSFTEDSGDATEYRRSSSLPEVSTKDGHFNLGKQAEKDLADFIKKNAWWTRSNWAFLNEPPVIAQEVPRYKYASQHHVADIASSSADTRIVTV